MIEQKTVAAPVHLEGFGLHLGEKVHLTMLPAPADSGIAFVRTDLPGSPRIEACLDNLANRPRRTALAKGDAEVHTIEHLMASLWALGIQNLEVQIDSPELPGFDGSALPFFEALAGANVVGQAASARSLRLGTPVAVADRGANIVAIDDSCLRVSYTLDYSSPVLGTQYFSLALDRDSFAQEIAPARTFVLEEEARMLQAAGLGKGANTQNTLVLGNDGRIIENELRFENEFVRHKILDLLGDLYLANCHVNAHVLATKSGHELNVQLARAIARQTRLQAQAQDAAPRQEKRRENGTSDRAASTGSEAGSVSEFTGPLDVRAIERILPHRYPFLLIDRVLEVSEDGRFGRGLKNVTASEGYFRGHFPDDPVMPGVLQIEAMAQMAGVLLLTHEQNVGRKAYLLSLDNVKFRRRVVPGDQLVLEATIRTMKKRTASVITRATVEGSLVAQAQIRLVLIAED